MFSVCRRGTAVPFFEQRTVIKRAFKAEFVGDIGDGKVGFHEIIQRRVQFLLDGVGDRRNADGFCKSPDKGRFGKTADICQQFKREMLVQIFMDICNGGENFFVAAIAARLCRSCGVFVSGHFDRVCRQHAKQLQKERVAKSRVIAFLPLQRENNFFEKLQSRFVSCHGCDFFAQIYVAQDSFGKYAIEVDPADFAVFPGNILVILRLVRCVEDAVRICRKGRTVRFNA